MTDIKEILHSALEDEPVLGLQVDDVVQHGRAARRRWTTVAAAGSVGAVALVAVGAVAVAGLGHSTPRHRATLSLGDVFAAAHQQRTSPHHPATSTPTDDVGGITADNLPGLVTASTGVDLVETSVSTLAAVGDLDLAAGLDVTGHPYLNVQVMPAGSNETTTPTCAQLSDLSSGSGDGYYGPCSIRHLADGSTLVVRNGTTTSGGFAMAQADLTAPDGSGIFAEDTNQSAMITAQTIKQLFTKGHGETTVNGKPVPPVVSDLPPLDSTAMTKLVQDLAAAQQHAQQN